MAADYKLQVALVGDDKQLKATLDRTIKDIQAVAAAAGKAVTPIEQMGNAAAKLRGIEALQKLTQDLKATEERFRTAKAELAFFSEGAKKAGANAGIFAADIARAQKVFDRLGQQLGTQKAAFGQLSAALRLAGVDTNALASATDALAREQQDAAQAADAEKRAVAAAAVAMEKSARIEQSRIKYYTELLNAQVQQIQKERELAAAAKATAEARSQGREQNRIRYYTDLLNQQVAAAQKARAEVDLLTKSFNKAEAANVRRGTVLTPTPATKGVGNVSGISAIADSSQKAASAMQRLRDAFTASGQAAQANSKAFNLMAGQVYGLVGAYVSLRGAWLAFADTFRQGTQLQVINASLKFAIGSAEGAAKEFAFLRNETDRLGISFDSAATQFAQLAAATRGTSLEGQKTRDIFLGIAEGARAAGLANEQVEGTLRAVTQIASKGTLQMEELRGQMGDRLPAALRLAADAMGVTQAELTSMVQAGKVTAEEFLPKLAEAFRRDAAGSLEEATKTGVASLARLDNAIKRLQRTVADSGFMREVTAAFEEMTKALDQAQPKARTFGAEFGRMVASLIEGARILIATFTEWWQVIKDVLIALLAYKALTTVSGWFVGLAGAVFKVADAFKAALTVFPAGGLGAVFGTVAVAEIAAAISILGELISKIAEYRKEVSDLEDLAKRKAGTIAALQKTLSENRADVRSPGATPAAGMSNAELRTLEEALAKTEEYWRAKSLLESEGGKQSSAATMERLRQARDELKEINTIYRRRLDIERENNSIIATEKKSALKQLEADLNNAYLAYKSYADKVKKLQSEVAAFGEKMREIRSKINEPAGGLTKGTVLEPVNLISQAKSAINEKDYERARKLAEKAADAVDQIGESGKATKGYLNSLLDQIGAVYNEASAGQEAIFEENKKSAEQILQEIMGKMDALKKIPIGFDSEKAIGDAQALRDQIQAIFSTITIAPGTYSKGNLESTINRLEPITDLEGYAAGGTVRGHGTPTSDSILARLSAGEFVIKAAAVQKYGAGLLDRINNLRLPRFAMGGLVPPTIPAFAGGGPVGTPVHLHIGDRTFETSAAPSVAREMARILGTEVLKRGRR